jgi:hypothetical protein
MADDARDASNGSRKDESRRTGGAKPEAGRTPSDKERSKQLSRAVSGREAARTVGTGRKPSAKGPGPARGSSGGATTAPARPGAKPARPTGAKGGQDGPGGRGRGPRSPKPGGGRRPPPPPSGRRSPTALLTWLTVAVVIVVVLVLVVVKVTQGSSTSGQSSTPLPQSIATDIATVPPSVFNTVGTTSSAATVQPPTVVHGQPPLTFTVNGKQMPGVFFFGAEYCPYCAAERWALSTAMARFGKFTGLRATASSSSDIFPNTQTLSFYKSTFTSSYVAFQHVEAYTNKPSSSGSYTALQKPTKAQLRLVDKYDTTKYISSLSSSSQDGSIPFIDFGNKVLQAGASYSPSILAGLTRSQIAADLHNPKNPVSQAIIATANYLSAAVCATDGGQPSSVCTSKGVTEAAKAMKLSI